MPAYRVYLLSPDDHFDAVESVEDEDAAAALEKAVAVAAGRPAEVWDGDRKLGRLNCGSEGLVPE